MAGLGRGPAVPLAHQKRCPRAESPTEAPQVDAELAPGDCLYVPRGFRHAARTAETASLHLTVGMLTRNWNDLLREVVELATEEAWFRESLPVGFANDPATLEPAWPTGWRSCAASSTRSTWPRWPTGPAAVLGQPAAAARGQLRALLSLDELDDATVLRRRPGATAGCASPAGGWSCCWATAP